MWDTEDIIEYRIAKLNNEPPEYTFPRCIGLGTDPVQYVQYLLSKGVKTPIELVKLTRNDCLINLPTAKSAVEKALGRRL